MPQKNKSAVVQAVFKNRSIQAFNASVLGVASKTSLPSMTMQGTGAGLPRAFEKSWYLLAPAKSLVTIFSQFKLSPYSNATASTTRVM